MYSFILGLSIYFLYGIRKSTGSDVPIPISRETGRPSLVPSIFIQPPTPWGSRGPTPPNTIRPPPPKRASVIDSVLVQNGAIVLQKREIEINQTEPDEKPELENTTRQSWNLGTPRRRTISETSSDSEGDSERNVSRKQKKNQITTKATVNAVNNHDDYYQKDSQEPVSSKPSHIHNDVFHKGIANAQESGKFHSNKPSAPPEDVVEELFKKNFIDSQEGYEKTRNEDFFKAAEFDKPFNQDRNKETFQDRETSLPSERSNETLVESKEDEKQIFNSENVNKNSDQRPSLKPLKASNSFPLDVKNCFPLKAFPSSVLDDGSASNSEPGTPMRPRNAAKPLVRASSFDNIPPSSSDSPFARRVKKFTIIPVEVPKNSEGADDLHTFSGECESRNEAILDGGHSLADADLKKKLLHLQQQQQQQQEADRSKQELPNGKPELLSSVLDPIRERGESKIRQEDIFDMSQRLEALESTGDRKKSIGSNSRRSIELKE